MANNEWDWEEFFKVAAQAAFVIGVGYVGYRIQEAEIDRLLNLSFDDGVRVIVESVPAMNNDQWQDFQSRLSNRAQQSRKAGELLYISRLLVKAENETREIISQNSPRRAAEIIDGIFRGKSQEEQFACVAILSYLSKSDYNARAVMGHLLS